MKPRRFVACSDLHGDQQDDQSVRAIMEFIKDFRPSVRVMLGDLWDFRSLRKGASDEEKAGGLEDDWRMGTEFCRAYFDGGKENHLLYGNHDARAWRIADSTTGLVRDYARDGIKRIEALMKRARVATLPYDSRLGVLKLGHLKMVHGYACGIGAGAKHARSYGNVAYGHVHTIDVAAVDSDEGPKEARCIGAMCKLDMPYNSHQLNKLRHSNGWAYGYLFPDGSYQLFQTRKVDGKFYAASEIKTY